MKCTQQNTHIKTAHRSGKCWGGLTNKKHALNTVIPLIDKMNYNWKIEEKFFQIKVLFKNSLNFNKYNLSY
jgi:hypothetical protein